MSFKTCCKTFDRGAINDLPGSHHALHDSREPLQTAASLQFDLICKTFDRGAINDLPGSHHALHDAREPLQTAASLQFDLICKTLDRGAINDHSDEKRTATQSMAAVLVD